MGNVTKINKSFKKTNYANQKLGGVGFQHLEFYHEASAGDTIINFGALNLPSEVSAEGFSNPSPVALSSANLRQNRGNLNLVTYRGKWVDRIDYKISDNNQIILKKPAEDGEVFHGTIHNVVRNTTENPDLQNIVAVGTLSAGQTIFNVGKYFKVNANPLTQIGEIMVFRGNSPVLMLRNAGNAAANISADGNYHEVDSNGGYGSTIEFNDAGAVGGENIIVISTGRLLERPSNSLLQEIETLAGQIDAIAPIVEDLAGMAPNTLLAAPNNVDLKSFGDLVLKILDMYVVESKPRYSIVSGSGQAYTLVTGKWEITNLATFTTQYDTLLNITNTGGIGTKFIALSDCEVFFSIRDNSNGSDQDLGIEHYSSTGTYLTGAYANELNVNGYGIGVSGSMRIKAGEYLQIQTNYNTSPNTFIYLYVKEEEIYKQIKELI